MVDENHESLRGVERGLKEPYRSLLDRLLQEALKKLGEDLVSFIVYGSVSRGEARPDSDIDILIVMRNPPKSRLRRQDIFLEIERGVEEEVEKLRQRGFNIDFSPVIKSVGEAQAVSPLYLDMIDDAVILYDKDNFFTNILEKLKARLRELGAEKVRVGRKWYWRLKKNYRFGEVIEI